MNKTKTRSSDGERCAVQSPCSGAGISPRHRVGPREYVIRSARRF